MPKIKYQEIRIGAERLDLVAKANAIIAEYQEQGYELTLRQLYYQFVSRDFIPNNMRAYKNLGDVINDGRMSGLIDWLAIVDRTRNLASVGTWESPSDIITAVSEQFRYDVWKEQPYYVEVWVEKDALAGVIERACVPWRVPYLSCRGYTSQSEMWSAGRRLGRKSDQGKLIRIIHLGDHDPSGIDMSRDIEDRLSLYAGRKIRVKRIALNMDQVQQYEPPPNPAKITDSRAEGYIAEYGSESWELDALEPSVLNDLITAEIEEVLDQDAWDSEKEREDEARAKLKSVADNWEKITKKLK